MGKVTRGGPASFSSLCYSDRRQASALGQGCEGTWTPAFSADEADAAPEGGLRWLPGRRGCRGAGAGALGVL